MGQNDSSNLHPILAAILFGFACNHPTYKQKARMNEWREPVLVCGCGHVSAPCKPMSIHGGKVETGGRMATWKNVKASDLAKEIQALALAPYVDSAIRATEPVFECDYCLNPVYSPSGTGADTKCCGYVGHSHIEGGEFA